MKRVGKNRKGEKSVRKEKVRLKKVGKKKVEIRGMKGGRGEERRRREGIIKREVMGEWISECVSRRGVRVRGRKVSWERKNGEEK